MGLGRKLLGGPHGHAADGSGGHINNARRYEVVATIGFGGFRRRVFDDLVAASGIQPGDRVLDVGCGTGYLSRRAALAVGPDGEVTGIDPSQAVLDYAVRTAPPNCTYRLAGGEALPQPDATFDAVISSLAIHHISPEHRPTAFKEMYRVLRPGGRLFVADFRPPRSALLNRVIGAVCGHAMHHNPVHELTGLATGAGFRITGSGDRRPWLHYIQAERPAGSAPAA